MRAIDGDALRDRLQNLGYDDWNQGTTTTWAEAFNECADMVDEQPTIESQRKKGMWIEHNPHKWGLGIVFECSECGEKIDCEPSNFCPNCGADMRTPVEIARNIVHEAIDNSVWSDTVDTTKMHKVVDDKYAEMTKKTEEPKKCDTCKHVKEPWFNGCADCSDYELWESKK